MDNEDLDLVIVPRPRDVGDIVVQRVLPYAKHRTVGPFLFFDEMGPLTLGEGQHTDVRPHPHIALATVTYLFAGEIVHRDSIGSVQTIRPGAVNWMTAGKGIVHSERSVPAHAGDHMHGIQLWCGLPLADEECEPAFEHYPAESLPSKVEDGAEIRVLAGEAFGLRSPVATRSKLFYVDVLAREATRIEIPAYAERAAYAVAGTMRLGGDAYDRGAMLVFKPDRTICMDLDAGTRLVLLGGDPLDGGQRHMYWNFVSSSKERIEQAKRDWRERKFPAVPGDDVELIPLPDDR
jgi:redox-sensitive bicupin YhaK (pirin superfamily)